MAIGKEKLKGALGEQANALEQSKSQIPDSQTSSLQKNTVDHPTNNKEDLLNQWKKTLCEEKEKMERSISDICKALEKVQKILKGEPEEFKKLYTSCGYTEEEIARLFTAIKENTGLDIWIEMKEKEKEEKKQMDLPIHLL